mmetsp:Transcript_162439/g.296500  ORF Transcript_162439/g.296500 Transcript_162439/m.296500 type:complete len:319 (+) Transcript_162439:107-1063(+)
MRFCFAVPRTSSTRRKIWEKHSRRNSKAVAWPQEGEAHCQSRASTDQYRVEPGEQARRPATPATGYRMSYLRAQRSKVAPEPDTRLTADNLNSRHFDDAFSDDNSEDYNCRAKLRAAAAAAAFTVLCGDDLPIPPVKVETPIPPRGPHPWQKLRFNTAKGCQTKTRSRTAAHTCRDTCDGTADIRQSPRESRPRSRTAAHACRDTCDATADMKQSPQESRPVEQGIFVEASNSQSAASNGLRFRASLEQAFDALSSASMANLSEELTLAKKMPLWQRRKLFLSLCRYWHPDKNSGNELQAKAMFQLLQNHKEWFLAES